VKKSIHNLQDKYGGKLGEKQALSVLNLSQESGMNYITGSNRLQLEMGCLEEAVEQDNPVRFIEAFVFVVEEQNDAI